MKNIFLVVFLILFVSGCTSYEGINAEIDGCYSLNKGDDVICLERILSGNITEDIDCELFERVEHRDECLLKLATLQDDKNTCNMISISGKNRAKCFKQFDINVGERQFESLEDCILLKDDGCFDQIARRDKDASICMMISEGMVRDNCRTALGDVSYCSEQKNESRVNCVTELANKNLDPKICDSLLVAGEDTNDGHFDCVSSVIHRFSSYQQCFAIEFQKYRDNCLHSKAAGNLSVCDMVVSTLSKGYCKAQIARDTNDSEICIELGNQRDECILNVVLENPTTLHCNKVIDDNLQVMCISNVIRYSGKVADDACSGIAPNDYLKICNGLISGDSTVCDSVLNIKAKQDCLEYVNSIRR